MVLCFNRRLCPVWAGAVLLLGLLPLAARPAAADGKTKVAYIPGLALAADVLQPDGVTPRTYNTPQGPVYWTETLPVQQGDKFRLKIFAATGGAELKEAKVRLDNAKIADLTAAPWSTTIDTTGLSTGHHMIEVWAQSTGDRPQSSTKTLAFYLTKALPAEYAVKGAQQVLQGGSVRNVPLDSAIADTSAVPEPPDFLKGQPVDDGAAVVLHARLPAVESALRSNAGAITLSEPTVFYVEAAPGSTATRYAYALARGGRTISAAPKPLALGYQRLRLQRRTDTAPGLNAGPVTLWVWGIDQDGHPSAPQKAQLVVP